MRILGIDPGYAIVGVGVIEYTHGRFQVVGYGAVTTQANTNFTVRLKTIYDEVSLLIAKYQPQAMAIEKLYFNDNQKTAIDVAQARGVILLAAANAGVPIYEFTPLQVKQAVVGYGRAEKRQMQEMTRSLLRLKSVPKPDDTADALAIAICHAHTSGSILNQIKRGAIQ